MHLAHWARNNNKMIQNGMEKSTDFVDVTLNLKTQILKKTLQMH